MWQGLLVWSRHVYTKAENLWERGCWGLRVQEEGQRVEEVVGGEVVGD